MSTVAAFPGFLGKLYGKADPHFAPLGGIDAAIAIPGRRSATVQFVEDEGGPQALETTSDEGPIYLGITDNR
jgi:hypothetical protein